MTDGPFQFEVEVPGQIRALVPGDRVGATERPWFWAGVVAMMPDGYAFPPSGARIVRWDSGLFCRLRRSEAVAFGIRAETP